MVSLFFRLLNCSPHYGPIALKEQIRAATDLCLHNIPKLRHKNELQPALFKHLQALALLEDNAQPFGRAMKISGLETLAQPLSLGPELQAAADAVENAGDIWTPEHLIKILHKRAAEWALLPTHKEVAAASVYRHSTQCHKWLGRGACEPHRRGHCKFAHDDEFKNRPDLLPSCPYMDNTGKCVNTSKNGCHYKHPPGTTLYTQPVQERAAFAVANPQTSELAELKAMILTLMKEGAEHKALITAILTESEEE